MIKAAEYRKRGVLMANTKDKNIYFKNLSVMLQSWHANCIKYLTKGELDETADNRQRDKVKEDDLMTTIAIRSHNLATPLGSTYSRAVEDFSKAISCPRSECDVYAIGIGLEYFVGSVFMALADVEKIAAKSEYTQLAMRQLDRKERIVAVNNDKLNQMIQYFYDHGGPVIEPPVDEQRTDKITPRFNTLINEFFNRMDVLVSEAYADRTDVDEIENEIDASVLKMYTTMKGLYREYELRNAFDEIISIRNKRD